MEVQRFRVQRFKGSGFKGSKVLGVNGSEFGVIGGCLSAHSDRKRNIADS
jgi:hypothetical protein